MMNGRKAAQIIIAVTRLQGPQAYIDVTKGIRGKDLLQTSQLLKGVAPGHHTCKGDAHADPLSLDEFIAGSGVDHLVETRAVQVRAYPNAAVLNLLAAWVIQLDPDEPTGRVGKELDGHGLQALGRRQLD